MAKLVPAVYGDALFDLAAEYGEIDLFYEEARVVLKSYEENADLAGLLNHPDIDKSDKASVIENSFGKFLSKEITGFLVTITDKNRSRYIPDIFKYFIDRVKEYKGIGTAYITTPMELNGDMKRKVEARLMQTTGYNRIEMRYRVDKSLIGGMIVRIGNRVIDSSIKNKLSGLARELKKIDI